MATHTAGTQATPPTRIAMAIIMHRIGVQTKRCSNWLEFFLLWNRTAHVHCRVGYENGPQVPDPRAPEWLPYVEEHEKWWDLIWDVQARRGDKVSTFVPEYGECFFHTLLSFSLTLILGAHLSSFLQALPPTCTHNHTLKCLLSTSLTFASGKQRGNWNVSMTGKQTDSTLWVKNVCALHKRMCGVLWK